MLDQHRSTSLTGCWLYTFNLVYHNSAFNLCKSSSVCYALKRSDNWTVMLTDNLAFHVPYRSKSVLYCSKMSMSQGPFYGLKVYFLFPYKVQTFCLAFKALCKLITPLIQASFHFGEIMKLATLTHTYSIYIWSSSFMKSQLPLPAKLHEPFFLASVCLGICFCATIGLWHSIVGKKQLSIVCSS